MTDGGLTTEERLLMLMRSAQASSFRESISIAIACGDWDEADRLDEGARKAGFTTGYSRPQ